MRASSPGHVELGRSAELLWWLGLFFDRDAWGLAIDLLVKELLGGVSL